MKKLISVFLAMCMIIAMSGTVYAASISANSSLMTADFINVKNFGAKGDGIADDTNAIQAAINAASYESGTVYFPAGTYAVGKPIALASNIRLLGAGSNSIISDLHYPDGTSTLYIFDSEYVHDITVEGLHFQSHFVNVREIHFLKFFASQRINVFNNICEGAGLVFVGKYGWTQDAEEHEFNRDIIIRDNYIDGKAFNTSQLYHMGIMVMRAENVVITGNRITDARHGIQWWGGVISNETHDSPLEVKRETKNIVITNNVITRVSGGGIWGAGGQHITISGNVIEDCHDVGIDPEGCYYVTISNNIVRNAVNGCITTFYFCRGTVITGNTVYSSVAGQYGLRVKNVRSSPKNEEIIVSGNTFVNTSGTIGYVGGGEGIEKITFQDNVFKNMALTHAMSSANRYLKVSGNQFTFDCPIIDPFNNTEAPAVRLGQTSNSSQVIVQDNIIRSLVPQAEGSPATCVQQADNGSSSENIISGNIISGFSKDMLLKDTSSRATVKQIFNVSDNILDSGEIEYSNVSVRDSGETYPVYNNNHMANGNHYVGEIPQEGYWRKGQIVYYNYPDMEGYVGAVCIESGTPGTWMSFGNIVNGE